MRSCVFLLAIISLFTRICFVALQTPRVTQAAPASASQAQENGGRKEAPKACPVTKPAAQPFVPPPPYWTDHGPDQFWYGTESLWTLLGVQGTWNIHNNVLESEGGYRTKLTYWQRGFDWRREPEPELIVVAKRLDRQAPLVSSPQAFPVFITGQAPVAMMTMIDIPASGCWDITAKYRDQKLSFVVLVQP